jgi:hypothetical protein
MKNRKKLLELLNKLQDRPCLSLEPDVCGACDIKQQILDLLKE